MKKIWNYMLLSSTVLALSCGGAEADNEESTDEENSDSTSVEVVEDEASELAFNGVDRDGYTLYGHTDMDAEMPATKDEMFQEWESTGSFDRKVEVEINSVCQKAGCWVTFLDQNDTEVYVYFRDHFTIPIETPSGTTAILLGSLYEDEVSVEMQKHLMEDNLSEGEELDEEAVAALEPKKEFAFDCESVLIKQ